MPLAFVDESESQPSKDPGVYILAAVLLDPADAADARDTLRRLRTRRVAKAHWHDADQSLRERMVHVVAALPLDICIVTHTDDVATRSERRRRHALRTLLMHFRAQGVDHIALESRGAISDRRDIAFMNGIRSQRLVAPEQRIEHIPGPEEPLLWAADIVAGATVQHRVGAPQYLKTLTATTRVTLL